MRPSRPSLQHRLLIPLLCLIALVCVAALGVKSHLRFESTITDLETKADSLLGTYSLLLSEPIASGNNADLYSYLAALLADSDVASFRVETSRSPERPLIDISNVPKAESVRLSRSNSVTLRTTSGEDETATITLGLTGRRAWQQFRHEIWMLSVTLAVLLAGTFLLARLQLNRVIRDPVDRMRQAIARFDATLIPQDIGPCGSADLDRLAESLRELQGSISTRHEQLQQALDEKSAHIGQLIEADARNQFSLGMARQLLDASLNSLAEGVIATDWSGRVSVVNRAAHRLLSVSPEDVMARPLGQVIRHASPDFERFIEEALQASAKKKRHSFDLRTLDDLREPTTFEVLANRFGGAEAESAGLVLVFRDVTEARRLQSRLKYEVSHDSLTGLLNRRAFDRSVKRALERSREDALESSVCFLDLDHFKTVNDTVGHAGGDRLLQAIGSEIQKCLGSEDKLARLGGDEFAVLLDGGGVGRARFVCRKIIDRISAYEFRCASHRFRVGCSAGIVAIAPSALSADELTDRADAACYQAKQRGRNCIHVHSGKDDRGEGSVHWVTELSEILENDQIEIWGQRICPAVHDNEIDWYEVLARVRSASGEVRLPEAFVRAAERYDKIGLLDLTVLGKTIDWMRERIPSHVTPLRCSINLSGKTISHVEYADQILERIARAGLPAGSLCVEITESELVQNLDAAEQFFKGLRDLDCLIALDDFGTGVCSFGYLRELNVDFVKIDGQFIRAMESSDVDRKVVEAICTVSRAMGVSTIAEYVADPANFAALAMMNIDYGQGFGLHKPAPMTQLACEDELFGARRRRWRDALVSDGRGSVA